MTVMASVTTQVLMGSHTPSPPETKAQRGKWGGREEQASEGPRGPGRVLGPFCKVSYPPHKESSPSFTDPQQL